MLARFRAFSDIHDGIRAAGVHAPVPEPPPLSKGTSLRSLYETFVHWVERDHATFSPENRKLLSIVKFLCQVETANYQLSNRQQACVAMLINGGACTRSRCSAMKPHVLAILYDALQSSANVVGSMKNVAKENSNHLRAATGNKAWKAHWARRVAEMVADFRKKWEQGHISDNINKLFLKEWETPMPKSRGVCFPDIYLNEDWRAAAKSPNNACYLFLDYPYFYENQLREDSSLDIEHFRERLRTFLESIYYKNWAGFQIKLCFMHAAFQKVATGKMLFESGAGGDGKGMEACLGRAVFSASASSTLDCGVFLERQEFRKSLELAWNKANIRIQEMSQHGHFISDLWKRFAVNEEIDCRVNYGFTSKSRFGTSMQVQELNFENIPIIEDSADRTKCCEHLRRRVVALLLGKATWTGDPAAVNPSEGVYLLLPQDDLVDFLSHPVTAALYLREWCIPFFLETTVREGLEMINHLDKVDPALAKDTEWLALRLSGSNIPPPATILA